MEMMFSALYLSSTNYKNILHMQTCRPQAQEESIRQHLSCISVTLECYKIVEKL